MLMAGLVWLEICVFTTAIFDLLLSWERQKSDYDIASERKVHSVNLKPLASKVNKCGVFVCLFVFWREDSFTWPYGATIIICLLVSLGIEVRLPVPCTWVISRSPNSASLMVSRSHCVFKSAVKGLHFSSLECPDGVTLSIFWVAQEEVALYHLEVAGKKNTTHTISLLVN